MTPEQQVFAALNGRSDFVASGYVAAYFAESYPADHIDALAFRQPEAILDALRPIREAVVRALYGDEVVEAVTDPDPQNELEQRQVWLREPSPWKPYDPVLVLPREYAS